MYIIQFSLDSWVAVTPIVVVMLLIMNRSCVYKTTFIRFLGGSTHIVVVMLLIMYRCCIYIWQGMYNTIFIRFLGGSNTYSSSNGDNNE